MMPGDLEFFVGNVCDKEIGQFLAYILVCYMFTLSASVSHS